MSGRYRNFALKSPQYRVSAVCPVSIFEPSVFTVLDGQSISGHGFGFGDKAHLKAIGEYFERFAAFRALHFQKRGRISELGLSLSEQEALCRALVQTCAEERLSETLLDHEFSLAPVRRLGAGDPCFYPAVFQSLHSFHNSDDSRFLPVRDSSGSAIHPDPETAFQSALLEFTERQCTTAMWVSRRCNHIASISEFSVRNERARITARDMMNHGDVTIYDISFLKGVHVYFVEYKSHRSGDEMVRFSCGCAAGFSPEDTLLKAFTEAWQTSVLIPQLAFFGAKEYGSDQLRTDFVKANNSESFELGLNVEPLSIGKSTSIGVGELTASILEVSENVYVYEKRMEVPGVDLSFCRVVSPDFYVHMSPGRANNNDNKWIDRFCGPEIRRQEPLPFT